MKTDSFAKKFLPLIITITFGVLLFLCVVGLELNLRHETKVIREITGVVVFQILSDAFLVPGVFMIGAALIGFFKYINLISLLYSAFLSLQQLITFGFTPKSCRKAYREYRKAAREESGTGLLILFVTGIVFLALSVIFLLIVNNI